ncbi:hypothetical protein C1Y40_05246 [Mycobacterium talmoniae]|uniref:Uncharacterized protein n=1 Tax=Mycobacterium talmoniae TaxID=1858794 RepID=A0A2S8BD82_9MYCO|nr:hypothetical protein C1Y40_05246 [Mycobacterium talmoniae]
MGAGVIRPGVGRIFFEPHFDDVAAALPIETRTGVADLVTADDRRAQQVGHLAVLRAGHQRQLGVVAAGEHILFLFAALGGHDAQRQRLDELVVALPQLLRHGNSRGEVSVGTRRRRRPLVGITLRRNRIDHRADVELPGLGQGAHPAGVAAGDGDHQVVTVDGDSRAGRPRAEHLLRPRQGLPGRGRSIGGPGRQGDSGTTRQVDAQLGYGAAAGHQHGQVAADQQNREHRHTHQGAHQRGLPARRRGHRAGIDRHRVQRRAGGVREFGCGVVALGRVLGPTPGDDGAQPRRDVRCQAGVLTGQACVQHAGQRRDIGARVGNGAEIAEVDEVVGVDQHGGRPEVAGRKPGVVGRVEGGRELFDDRHGAGGVQPALLGEDGGQVAALDEPHVEVEAAVDVAVVVDRHDVRVVEVRGATGVVAEALRKLRIRGELRGQHLDGDDAVGAGVVGAIHLAGVAAAHHVQQLVAPE